MANENKACTSNGNVPVRTLRTCQSEPNIGTDLRDAKFVMDRSRALFQKRIDDHAVDMLINPFSEFWGQDKCQYHDSLQNAKAVWKDADKRTKLIKADDKYGLPVEGTLTHKRGIKAKDFITKNIIEVCETIDQLSENEPDEMKSVKFGVLFKAYERINDKLVGLLVRARKHGLVEFPGEMLYQRQDEEVDIKLIKVPSFDELNLKFIAFNKKQEEGREAARKVRHEARNSETNGEHCIQ